MNDQTKPVANPDDRSREYAGLQLNLFDSVCIIVGTIVGAGIFMIPTIVAGITPNVTCLLVTWLVGGGIALVGAMCFAELTTTYPDAGGDYGYLKRAFGRPVGFAFAWTAFWIIRPGNIGAMAFTFGSFAIGIGDSYLSSFAWAVLAVVLITALNLMGMRSGKAVQNGLTVVKISAILSLLLAAIIFHKSVESEAVSTAISDLPVALTAAVDPSDALVSDAAVPPMQDAEEQSGQSDQQDHEWFWLSMVFVMFAFGGWNDIAFVASEVKNPRKNLLRALMLGTGGVVVIYLLVHFSLLYGLGFDRLKQMASSENLNGPLVLAQESFGEVGGLILGLAVCVSSLGAISAMVFTSPRIYWAAAEDDPRIRKIVGNRGRAWLAISIQAAVTLIMMAAFSQTSKGFGAIVPACAPYFWSFLSLTVIAMVVNRIRYQGQFSGVRVPLFPLPPIIFVAVCWFMTARSLQHTIAEKLHWQALAIGGWVLVGLVIGVVMVLSNRKSAS